GAVRARSASQDRGGLRRRRVRHHPGDRGVVRLQVRPAHGLRRRVRRAFLAEPQLDRRTASAHRACRGGARLRTLPRRCRGLSRHLLPAARSDDRRLPSGGEALHDDCSGLHRRETPERGDGRGPRRTPREGTGSDGERGAPGSGARVNAAETPDSDSTPNSASAPNSEAVPGPAITALGGGHGLYATLSAVRRLTDRVTAVVTVADDGGSSGRLRAELGVVPPGDLRMALVALAGRDDEVRVWTETVQHRFGGTGALAGHSVGNLILAGLAEVAAATVTALDMLARV